MKCRALTIGAEEEMVAVEAMVVEDEEVEIATEEVVVVEEEVATGTEEEVGKEVMEEEAEATEAVVSVEG